MRWSVLAVLVCGLALGGCRNSCQLLCVRMAKVAEDECGFTVPDEQLTACIDAQAGSESKDDRATCREFGDVDAIKNEWSCEQLGAYWGAGGDGGGGGGGGGTGGGTPTDGGT